MKGLQILNHYMEYNRTQTIFKKSYQKAEKQGWIVDHTSAILLQQFKSSRYKKESLYYPVIFSKSFSKALGYTLEDLGKWCDEGKDPLEFINNLI